MSNCLLARNGYPRIAYAACLGSPIFNILIGAGVPYLVKISLAKEGPPTLSFTLTQGLLFSTFLLVLVTNVIVAICSGFRFRRPHGVVLIVVYFIFLTIAILIEVDIILPPESWNLLTGTE